MHTKSRNLSVFCALLAVVSVLVSYPVLEAGFCDDWAYAKASLDFVKTGHLVFNGWESAMMAWQIVWGAAVIKLFGFSFLALRLSVLPFAAGCAVLLFSIGRRLGLNDRSAILCTLTIVLSPVVLPLATSFMSDWTSEFWLLLSLYACLRALAAPIAKPAMTWLGVAALASLVGGSGRQIVWLGVLVIVPCTAWLLRSIKGVWLSTAVYWVLSFVVILACTVWFNHQPYAVPESFAGLKINFLMIYTLGHNLVTLSLTLLLFCTPVLVCYLSTLKARARRHIIPLTALFALILYLGLVKGPQTLAPWMVSIVTPSGVNSGIDGIGRDPIVLGTFTQLVITLFMAIVSYAFVAFVCTRAPLKLAPVPLQVNTISWIALAWLLVPFSLAYLILLLPRAALREVSGAGVFDRYVIPLLPVILIIALRLYQEKVSPKVPAYAFLTLTIFSAYAIASTHDFYSTERARLRAITSLTTAGIPRTAIQGGFADDGWTQLDLSGHLNDFRIVNPKGTYHPVTETLPKPCRFWFAPRTPSIDPKYFVVYSPLPCLSQSVFPPLSYEAWLPPLHRQFFIQGISQ